MTKNDPFARFGEVPQFTLSSTDLTDGAPLPPAQYGARSGGADRSPQLSWSGFPPETQSFAVTVYDPDAPSGFLHWAVCNLPASVTSLAAGAGSPGSPLLPAGALALPNELGRPAFVGAGPPPGTGTHRYQFVVHALDVATFTAGARSTPALLAGLRSHTLAWAVLEATAVAGGAAPGRR